MNLVPRPVREFVIEYNEMIEYLTRTPQVQNIDNIKLLQ